MCARIITVTTCSVSQHAGLVVRNETNDKYRCTARVITVTTLTTCWPCVLSEIIDHKQKFAAITEMRLLIYTGVLRVTEYNTLSTRQQGLLQSRMIFTIKNFIN